MCAQLGFDTSLNITDLGDSLRRLPILILNVHSRCNCRCVMCDIWKRQRTTEITARDLDGNRESLRRLGVEQVVLSGGEPLLHSHLRGICTLLREENIRLALLTTGLLLRKRAADVAELFDNVIVSLDGPPDVHDAIRRVNGAFDLMERGIAAVREIRPEIRICARTTVQKANHRHICDTVTSARSISLDGISFLAADLTSEAFNRHEPWSDDRQSQIALDINEVETLQNEIEHVIRTCSHDIDSGYIAENSTKLRRIVLHFRAHLGQATSAAPLCNAPWVSAVVESDGAVRPCFFHPPVGNIRNSSLEAALNGENGRAFRDSLNIAENPVCRRCVCSLNHRAESRRPEAVYEK